MRSSAILFREVFALVQMTVLHIASPFAFSAPVSESRLSNSTGDDQSGKQQEAAQTQADPTSNRSTPTRDNNLIDARDARSALMRTVDLAGPGASLSAVSASVDTVLAAYQQDVSFSEEGENEPTA